MTVPVFVVDNLDDAAPGALLTIEGEEARHAARVRRLKPPERVDVVDGRGRRVRGTVAAVTRDHVVVDIDDVIDEPPPDRRLVVVQALAKGDRAERAVESLTEVGVDVIVPWAARRSVVSWDADRAERAVQRWRSIAREAAKQSRRSMIPEVCTPVDLAGACAWISRAGWAVVLEGQGQALPALLRADEGVGDWVVVVGPEGGFDDGEISALCAAGARLAALGPTVLRTSTAGTVALAVIASAHRWSIPSLPAEERPRAAAHGSSVTRSRP